MKIFRILNGFDSMSDTNLLSRSKFIRDQMVDNPHFTQPQPSITELSESITSFDNAIQKALTGNKQDGMERDELRVQLIENLHLISNYVLFTAAGRPAVATSSGFTISRQRESRPALAAPTGVRVVNGTNPNELELRCDAVAGSRAYMHEYTTGDPLSPATVWNTQVTTLRTHLFTNLQRGTVYYCRVAAIGSKQQKMYSEIVSRMVV
jgi:hypothetical protein